MKAMVFAAGLGTRLRPYTDDRPKALVTVGDLPLLAIALRRLKHFGFDEVVVNVHHYAQQIMDFLAHHHSFGLRLIISDERDQLLDTGGGLLRAVDYLGQAPFLVHNVDIMSDLDLGSFYRSAVASGHLATLAVRQRSSSRYLLFDPQGRLGGWRNARTGEEIITRPPADQLSERAFSGISVFQPAIFDHMSSDPPVFSVIDTLLQASSTSTIAAYDHTDGQWLDVGRPSALVPAAQLLSRLALADA